MVWWAALINSIAAVGAVGFAILALINPTALSGNASTHRYYPAMYASRSIPLNIMVGIIGWLSANPAVVLPLVGVALVTQLFDAAIGGIYRIPGMITGGIIAALCHGLALMTVL